MKSDLNAILPAKLSEHLLFRQTDVTMTYEAFKAFVESQTNATLMVAGRLASVNNVKVRNEGPTTDDDQEEQEEDEANVEDMSRSDLLAMVKRGRAFQRPKRQANGSRTATRFAPNKDRKHRCENSGAEGHPTR